MSTAAVAVARPLADREATALWRPAWERFLGEQPDREATWVGRLRRSAFARFEELGLPTSRQEAWRKTNVAKLAATTFHRPGVDDRPIATSEALRSLTFDGAFEGRQIVFVDGRHAPELSSLERTAGLTVRSLREVLAHEPRLVEPLLDRQLGEATTVFGTLNSAFLEDGAVVLVEPGAVVEAPLHVVFYSTGGAPAPLASHPRLLVHAGRASQLTLVESYGGPDGAVYLTNAVTEFRLEDGAVVEHAKVQREGLSAFHVANMGVRQGRDSRFTSHSIALGGALARNDVDQAFGGEGGECTLNGLFVVSGAQHVDSHTRIDHATPRCASRETYKGVLDGASRGVFQGTILVRPGAQKTDSWQVNKNLLLSDQALVDSTPVLQIHADDVRCKHGSTTGQIEPSQLFYLRSRGIGEATARALLVYAFASDVVHHVKVEPLRLGLELHLQRRLPGALDFEEASA